MNSSVTGALAGLAATVPMTAAMAAMHRFLPPEESYPLPPRLITENALEKVDAHDELPEEGERGLALVNHFAYGTAMGAIYASGLEALEAEPTVANGVAFGLGVWAGSYQALLPLTGLFPPAHKQPAMRNALMIAAHIVWGAALGLAVRKLGNHSSE
jgi:uncharacterized membrane protein YagU involved in acid resistance